MTIKFFLKKIKNINKKFLIFLLLGSIYFLSYGLMLLNQGIYWDDWCLVNQDRKDLISMFSVAGSSSAGLYHYIIHKLPYSVFFYRIITFSSYFIAGLLIYFLLTKLLKLHEYEKICIVILFLTVPINAARVTLICNPYAVNFLFFWAGFSIFVTSLCQKKPLLLIFAYPLLWLSFFTQSLLFFALLPAGFLIYKITEKTNKKFLKNKMNIAFLLIFLIPFLFFYYKTVLNKPFGLMENYNKISWENLVIAPNYLEPSFNKTIADIFNLNKSTQTFLENVLNLKTLFFIGIGAGLIFYKKSSSPFFLLTGIFLWILGAFPYNCLREIDPSEWTSRDQLLLGIGLALIFWGLISCFCDLFLYKWKHLCSCLKITLVSILLIFFTFKNIYTQASFIIDWQKQLSFILNIKQDPRFRDHNLFLLNDKTLKLNAFSRNYRFYEINGMFRRAFGDAKRFGTIFSEETLTSLQNEKFWDEHSKYVVHKVYNCWQFEKSNKVCIISILPGSFFFWAQNNKILKAFYILYISFNKPDLYSEFLNNLIIIY